MYPGPGTFADKEARNEVNANLRRAYLLQDVTTLFSKGLSLLGKCFQATFDGCGEVPRKTQGKPDRSKVPIVPASSCGG